MFIVSQTHSKSVKATTRFPRHHALRYRMSLATPLATAVAVDVETNSDTEDKFLA